jgi:hypothetical protein
VRARWLDENALDLIEADLMVLGSGKNLERVVCGRHPTARPELDRATDRSGRCRWTHSAVCDGAMALPSESAHRVFVPTPMSSCHRTYGVGEGSGRIRLRDEPGARRQLAGAGPDAAGPDQDADPG